MIFNNLQFSSKKRRGLSSIVGALLFVVLMVATFSVLGVALNSQTDIASTGRDVAAKDLQKQQEDFNVDVFTDGSQILFVNVNNLGQNPVEIFSLVISNQTGDAAVAADFPTNIYDIPADSSFITPGSSKNILENTSLKLNLAAGAITPEIYGFKIISALGTIKTDTVICNDTDCIEPVAAPGAGSLSEVLFLDGPNGINSKNSTIVMFVTNTSDETITNVKPVKGFPTLVPAGSCNTNTFWTVTAPVTPDLVLVEDVNPCNVEPNTPQILGPHETGLFKWDGEIQGDVGAVFKFCNSATGDDGVTVPNVDSLPESCDTLTVIDPNDCGGCEGGGDGDNDPLDEKFITRPELFLTIPSPFGEGKTDTDRALWGANVVNPTDTPMYIHKITITAFPPASNDNFDVIKNGGSKGHDCLPQDIFPGTGIIPGVGPPAAKAAAMEAGSWTCPGSNTIMWRNYTNPILLAPQSTVPFMVRLAADFPMSLSAESVLVDSTVYTTSGSFGKGNYQSTAYDIGMYANIFQVTDPADPLNTDNWISSVTDIPSGSEQTFHMALTDFDTNYSTFINSTSKVVINVPRAFTLVDMVAVNGFDWDQSDPDPTKRSPSVTIHPDKTTQIIATLTNDLGDTPNEYATISFKATAPIVTQPKLMVMYTLANGLGTNNNSVGPLAEIILVVVP